MHSGGGWPSPEGRHQGKKRSRTGAPTAAGRHVHADETRYRIGHLLRADWVEEREHAPVRATASTTPATTAAPGASLSPACTAFSHHSTEPSVGPANTSSTGKCTSGLFSSSAGDGYRFEELKICTRKGRYRGREHTCSPRTMSQPAAGAFAPDTHGAVLYHSLL